MKVNLFQAGIEYFEMKVIDKKANSSEYFLFERGEKFFWEFEIKLIVLGHYYSFS